MNGNTKLSTPVQGGAAVAPQSPRNACYWSFLWPVLLALISGLSLVGWKAVHLGSWADACAYWQGYALTADPACKSVGTMVPGEKKQVVFTVRNVSSEPVTIVGAQTNCSCLLTNALPLRLAARERGELVLEVALGSRAVAGPFSPEAILITDADGPRLVLKVTGDIQGSAGGAQK